ncbi:MAG: lipoyl(octanoyl) transferase LipB [Deferrisomatales bacterium]
MASLRVLRLAGRVPYGEAHGFQLELLEQRRKGRIPDTLVLLEHEPVITLGRNADPAGVLADPTALAAAGIRVHRVERGGQATYHGPGQAVGYPILNLPDRGLGARVYVHRLEEVMIRTAAELGVTAARQTGRPGIYTRGGKLGAVGVAISRGVSYHGFAFNASPDLSHFRLIVPCGQPDVSATSLEAHLGRAPPLGDVFRVLEECFRRAFPEPGAPREGRAEVRRARS